MASIQDENTALQITYTVRMENNIKSYSRQGIEELLASLGQPRFRSKQVVQWLYQHGVSSYDEMTNLPAALRAQLAHVAPLTIPKLVDKQTSHDGTRKYLWEFSDGARVETVAIPSRDISPDKMPKRLTICFSTQVGCPMACAFCATGKEGFGRNLTPGEMVDQIIFAGRDMGCRVTNLVAMGQGEPFLNYDNTRAALHFLNSADGLEVGARHITVSTCGIIAGIRRFATEPEQFTLAISLHSALQSTRDALMPKVASSPLTQLRAAIIDYTEESNRRVTFEYLLIKDVNDGKRDLDALKRFCKGLLCHVNLLPINAVSGSPYQPASPNVMRQWTDSLQSVGIETTVRNSRGSDIDGACGQLKNATH
ncbi:MAG: 23S rRNA (adenine(2503)-C(2))-methyltransferase RlmN [Raoultibacter sp.]